jgi:glutathionylspermidine synthase
MRFDFHFTTEGWRISEVNSDVPGGLNEASGFPSLFGAHYPWASPVGDPVGDYVESLARHAGASGTVAFVHATAYSDDLQMMSFVAGRLASMGVSAQLVSPAHLRWNAGQAYLESAWCHDPLTLVVRFFPAEWLIGLPSSVQWTHLFAESRTPLSNPATAILTQTKRFPLVWDDLSTPLETWRAVLPETRDPRDVSRFAADEWVIKPALGRVGEGVGISGIVVEREMQRIVRSARWRPSSWVLQRRFNPVPLNVAGAATFPCLGVYTLDGRAIGAYGRLSSLPLIDSRAADAAVLAA